MKCVDECLDESICLKAITCLLKIANVEILTSLNRRIALQLRQTANDNSNTNSNTSKKLNISQIHPTYLDTVITDIIAKIYSMGFESINSEWLACAILELSAVNDDSLYLEITKNKLSKILIQTVQVEKELEVRGKIAKRAAQYLFEWQALVCKSEAIWIVTKYLQEDDLRAKFIEWLSYLGKLRKKKSMTPP